LIGELREAARASGSFKGLSAGLVRLESLGGPIIGLGSFGSLRGLTVGRTRLESLKGPNVGRTGLGPVVGPSGSLGDQHTLATLGRKSGTMKV
jgi:hypothetical protein